MTQLKRTTILADPDLLDRVDRHARRLPDDEDRGDRGRPRGVPRGARRAGGAPVRGHRAQRPRTPLARRPADRRARDGQRGAGPTRGSADVAVLLDASAILAAADTADLNHAAARAWFARVDEPLLIGALTLAEADHVLQRELGLARARWRCSRRSRPAARPGRAAHGGRPRERRDAAGCRRRAPAAAVRRPPRRRRPSASAVRRVATFDRRPLAVLAPRGPRGERLIDLEP